MFQDNLFRELVIDNFAGGGGAGTGMELAQGFPKDYVIDIEQYIGKKYSEQKQIARLGNAVCPPVATALVRANLSEMETPIRIESMQKLYRVICGDLSKKRKAG